MIPVLSSLFHVLDKNWPAALPTHPLPSLSPSLFSLPRLPALQTCALQPTFGRTAFSTIQTTNATPHTCYTTTHMGHTNCAFTPTNTQANKLQSRGTP